MPNARLDYTDRPRVALDCVRHTQDLLRRMAAEARVEQRLHFLAGRHAQAAYRAGRAAALEDAVFELDELKHSLAALFQLDVR